MQFNSVSLWERVDIIDSPVPSYQSNRGYSRRKKMEEGLFAPSPRTLIS